MTKGQTTIYKTLHRKQKTNPTKTGGVPRCFRRV